MHTHYSKQGADDLPVRGRMLVLVSGSMPGPELTAVGDSPPFPVNPVIHGCARKFRLRRSSLRGQIKILHPRLPDH